MKNRAVKAVNKVKIKAMKLQVDIINGSDYYLIGIPFEALSLIDGVKDSINMYRKLCTDLGVIFCGSMEMKILVPASTPLKWYIKHIKNIAEYGLIINLFGDICNFEYSRLSSDQYSNWVVQRPMIPICNALKAVADKTRICEQDASMSWHDYQNLRKEYEKRYLESGEAFGYLKRFAENRDLFSSCDR